MTALTARYGAVRRLDRRMRRRDGACLALVGARAPPDPLDGDVGAPAARRPGARGCPAVPRTRLRVGVDPVRRPCACGRGAACRRTVGCRPAVGFRRRRLVVSVPLRRTPARHLWRLRFDGLATVADVVAERRAHPALESMFVAHAVDVSSSPSRRQRARAPLSGARSAARRRRPRPRWRGGSSSSQALRWHRTSLLGPHARLVSARRAGRSVAADCCRDRPLHVDHVAHPRAELDGDDGVLSGCRLRRASPADAADAVARCTRGHASATGRAPGRCRALADGRVRLDGDPARADARAAGGRTRTAQPLYTVRRHRHARRRHRRND